METANVPNAPTDLQSVIDWMGFATADAKYQALVAVTKEEELTNYLSSYTAPDDLSVTESRVFRLDASEIPALFWAYERYINLMGCVDIYFGEFVDEERREYPQFYHEGEWCFGRAVGFMVTACKLPQPECMAWVCKIVAAEIRGGLYEPYDPLDD